MQNSYDNRDWDQHINRGTKQDLNQKVFSYLALFEDSWDTDFHNLIWTWNQNENVKSRSKIQLTLFPCNDLTSYFWGVSIFRAELIKNQDKLYQEKTREEFRKYQMFLFTLLPDDSVSRACQVSQTVRWRFISVNGTLHRGITKPFF